MNRRVTFFVAVTNFRLVIHCVPRIEQGLHCLFLSLGDSSEQITVRYVLCVPEAGPWLSKSLRRDQFELSSLVEAAVDVGRLVFLSDVFFDVMDTQKLVSLHVVYQLHVVDCRPHVPSLIAPRIFIYAWDAANDDFMSWHR